MKASDALPGWDYAGSLEKEIEGVPSASDLVTDYVTEHNLTGGVNEEGMFTMRVSVWPAEDLQDEVNHFYPGAIIMPGGMVVGGWPTDEELVKNRRPGGHRSVRSTVRDWWVKR